MITHLEEELLQRYFDGDLLAEEATRVASHLAECEACAARHRSLTSLRVGVGVMAEERAGEVDFDALFARIERGIAEAAPASLSERVRGIRVQFGHNPRRVWVPAMGVLAAAAALILFVRGGPVPNSSTEIEEVAFSEWGGTVFEVALADGASTKVVWINDEYEDDDDDDEVLQ
jgi:anti-sigma factor RsiW